MRSPTLGSPKGEKSVQRGAQPDESQPQVRASLINDSLRALINREKELDYLTHIVFRMFERFQVPPSDPRRFRIEILFSNGVNMHPFKNNTVDIFDKIVGGASSSDKGAERRDDEDISDELLKEVPIQNDRIKPDDPYLTLSTMEEYLANFNRRGNRDSHGDTPGKKARSSSVGSDGGKSGSAKSLFA